MTSKRLAGIPGFSIDRVAAQAGDNPDVLRLENLDTDLRPPHAAIAATRAALERDNANSYLPFTGNVALCRAVARHVSDMSGIDYAPNQVVITCGGTEGMFDALLAIIDPGDEVVLTDPTYAGMIYRVKLAGGVPQFAPFVQKNNQWVLDSERLATLINTRTKAMFIMNPSMPSGGVLSHKAWAAIARLCEDHNLWLIYNAAMERILYDKLPYIHPASFAGMAQRTITVGSVSKEFRMIGWRLGWVVGPGTIMPDIARAHIYNVVTPTGIAQSGALAALEHSQDSVGKAVSEWERRRDEVMRQLQGYPAIIANGGWSLLLDVGRMGLDSFTASERLLTLGQVAATPMKEWGEQNSDQFVRIVFSNEPVARLSTLKDRVQKALG